ncbi:MAG TPA: DUF4976 domain-containing protein [Verrucomicrobiales bacterium]|nr:DUF4976 domain-containing protein [Verrucomicrobiales bacterium]HIL72284.1 DUF4976 domain-containing protein [Verrucomicrobiota bacterium]
MTLNRISYLLDRIIPCSRRLLEVIFWSCLVVAPLEGEDLKSPNLLIIQTDEHNFRTLGCYRETLPPEQAYMWGPSVVTTPNIDWIAHNGALCTSFYATTPVCSSSRAALVSGRYPQNTDVVSNNIPMNGDIVTFAEILRRQGYANGYAGKWHLDGDGKPQWAPKRKFGFQDNRFMFNRGHWKKLKLTSEGPKVAGFNNKGQPNYSVQGADASSFTTDFLTDRTLEFIKGHANKPFCYWVSYPDPHGPDTVRAPYDSMFSHQNYQKPRTFEIGDSVIPKWAKPGKGGYKMSSYYGMVKCIDDNIGRLLTQLKELKMMDRTIIVFTSDHGDLRGEHHQQNKGIPYEASAKIPFLMYYPGKVPPGTVVNQALSCVDFMPTILTMMGKSLSGKEEGRDASTLFVSRQKDLEWEDVAFLRSTGTKGGWISAVTSQYKLIYSAVESPWLFDLQKDPDELTNFADHPDYRHIVARLSQAILDYGKHYDDPFVRIEKIRNDLKKAVH